MHTFALTTLVQNRVDGRKEKVGNNLDAALERDLRLAGCTRSGSARHD
jgi:hypothetical protein